ncbi:MAG: class I SAM-dependent methyltransferase [Caulobacteraceae bacterium]
MAGALENGRLWGWRARDWAEIQEGQMSAAYETILKKLALEPGQSLLDVACGAGMFASMASGRGLRVSGIDASDALLTIARERAPSADFRLGDLESLPFPDGSFDAVTGFNAFQFAANPVAALSAAGRAAKRGAPVVVAIWGGQEAAQAATVFAALARLLESSRASSPKTVTLSEEAGLRRFADDSGLLGAFEVETIDTEWSYPNLATAIRGLNSAGSARLAADRAGEEAVTRAHEAALQPYVKADGTVRLGAVFRYIIGRAP